MTLQEDFERQYEALNAYPAGFMLSRRLAEAYSEPRETRAYRWFVRGRSFGIDRQDAAGVIGDCVEEMCADKVEIFGVINVKDWIAIGSLMGWIPEKEK